MLALVGIAIFIGLLFWLTIAVERAPVSRTRLEQFARRHRLMITTANGNQVIRYLAVTRRWRASGLALGVLGSIGWALAHDAVRIDSLTLFAGWFAGALVAELRVARVPSGQRRAASLTPRTPQAYLPRLAWALVPFAALVSLTITSVTAVQAIRGLPVQPIAWPLSVGALAVAVAVMALQRRAVRRAQPADEPDVMAADDAIRSRSLHVLAGGGMSLVLYLALGQAQALIPTLPDQVSQQITGVSQAALFFVPVVGWAVAVSFWSVRRGEAPAPPVAASGAL